MAILWNEDERIWTLETKNSSYQMYAEKHGVLLHTYYGRKINGAPMDYLIQSYDRGFSGNPYDAGSDRTFSFDTLPLEYPGQGIGDYRTGCLDVINSDGSSAVDLRYTSFCTYTGKYGLKGLPALYQNSEEEHIDTLEITLQDTVTGVQVILYYGVFEERDIITRACRIENRGKDQIRLNKALTLCLDFPEESFDLIHFYGRHAMERELERIPLHHGIQSVGSIRGTSSHQHNPFFILCDHTAKENSGNCYGISFLYSGSFTAEIEKDQFNQIRAVMGIHPEQFSFLLSSEDCFTTPETVLSFSSEGFSKLSQNFHKIIRHNLCRGEYKEKCRPILINNWEATYFNFNTDKLVKIAEDAAALGIEMLVMDDGWFGKRDDDNSGLGDWYVNENKIAGGLNELVKKVNAAGMKFGIWFEPEMVSEDSELYRTHSDWCFVIPGRPGNRSRNQFVLDMSREDVRGHILEQMYQILDNANIAYIKWDMNRSITNIYSAKVEAERQGEVCHNYILGIYEILETLLTRYPKLLIEGCSGGGGRFDAGMLYYTPQIWCSDNTDAIERLKIQYGTSFGYPICTVGSHVSASPNHQTGRNTSLAVRGVTAMAGSFGYELDINQMTVLEKEQIKQQVTAFKKFNTLIHQGDYYRLTSPYENEIFTAWMIVSETKEEALLSVVKTKAKANGPVHILRLAGLAEDKIYQIGEQKRCYSGASLLNGGLPFSFMEEVFAGGDYAAVQYEIKTV